MEIYRDILKAVAGGKNKPTHVMYRANLSWARLKKCLDLLMNQGLLNKRFNDGSVVFSITPKGKDVLGYFKKIESELYPAKSALPSEVYAQYR
jgi:predicted transcriptional regulator